MEADSWLVIGDDGKEANGLSTRTSSPVNDDKTGSFAKLARPAVAPGEEDASSSSLPRILDTQNGDEDPPNDPPSISINDFLSANYFDALESKYNVLSEHVSRMKDAATNTYTAGLSKFKLDAQQFLSDILREFSMEDAGVSTKVAIDVQDIVPQTSQDQNIPSILIEELIPQLRRSDHPLFNGSYFQAWYDRVQPVFDRVLASQDPSLYLWAVKVYSEPSIAALLDDMKFNGAANDWNQIVKQLDSYFNRRTNRMRKYEAIHRAQFAS